MDVQRSETLGSRALSLSLSHWVSPHMHNLAKFNWLKFDHYTLICEMPHAYFSMKLFFFSPSPPALDLIVPSPRSHVHFNRQIVYISIYARAKRPAAKTIRSITMEQNRFVKCRGNNDRR